VKNCGFIHFFLGPGHFLKLYASGSSGSSDEAVNAKCNQVHLELLKVDVLQWGRWFHDGELALQELIVSVRRPPATIW
jgi:hypothetical protein